jgi:hypothetical protein
MPKDAQTLFEPPTEEFWDRREGHEPSWEQHAGPPGRREEPPEPEPLPDLPTEDDWVENPKRAMKALTEWTEALVKQRTSALEKTVTEQRDTISQLRDIETNRIAKSFSTNMREAYDGINKHYATVFSKDETILHNPQARARLDQLVVDYTNFAINKARREGDFEPLQYLAGQKFARHALKLVEGEVASTGRLDVDGAATVTPQGAPAARGDGLPADISEAVAAARAEGYDISVDKIKAALAKRPAHQVD